MMRNCCGVLLVILLAALTLRRVKCEQRRLVKMTLVRNSSVHGAYCLDGSSPAYHLDRGFGDGARNWLLQFEGGGWCTDVKSCSDRANSRRGSTKYMSKYEVFSGILSNNASLNPDFYNWNRVKLRYCDGASFAGDSIFTNETSVLYFRGQRIWQSIILDLLPKGLKYARKALLSGCSAGGLASFLHCDNFTSHLPKSATVKCLSDAGFFLDARDISLNHTMRSFYEDLVSLQGVEQNLNKNCTRDFRFPKLCIFPQYAMRYIETPFFILNSAYDVYQFHHILVPPSADLRGKWNRCKTNPANCNAIQLDVLQGFRHEMIGALRLFYYYSREGGLFINSCFAHCQSESQDTWYSKNSPRVNNKTIAEAVGDWYFGRELAKEVDIDSMEGAEYEMKKHVHSSIEITSDSGVYDENGSFVSEKFEAIFANHAHTRSNALNTLPRLMNN